MTWNFDIGLRKILVKKKTFTNTDKKILWAAALQIPLFVFELEYCGISQFERTIYGFGTTHIFHEFIKGFNKIFFSISKGLFYIDSLVAVHSVNLSSDIRLGFIIDVMF